MGVYRRYKKDPDGFRNLVSLLETTPPQRRQRMIEAGMAEDPAYTRSALGYMMTFEEVVELPEAELAEVLVLIQPRILAMAILGLEREAQSRVVRCAPPKVMGEVMAFLEAAATPAEIQSARLMLVGKARECEKAGKVRTKQIPR